MAKWWVRVLNFIGGAIGRAAGTGLAVGGSLIFFGMSPAEIVIYFWNNPPPWVVSAWTRPFVLIMGLALIYASLRFNLWDQRQKAVDELAEDVSWAIRDILNRPKPTNQAQVAQYVADLDREYREWCERVDRKLENRAFFTRADQLHFQRLGFIAPVVLTGIEAADYTLSQLNLKFDRLRDVINWVQQRRR